MPKRISGLHIVAKLLICGLISSIATVSFAAGGGAHIDKQKWTFNGFFGYYDRAQLQRGYQVYKEVCASCHGLKFLSYRNLGEKGGPEFPEDQVKALAKEAEVQDGPNEDGEMFGRPGRPSDRFVSPFKNDNEARSANGGALPPDLSVIAKARNAHQDTKWFLEPVKWFKDIVNGYQEGGPDYLYALLTGYKEAPKDIQMNEGMNYNKYFPGYQIAMASPLTEGIVEYSDGSPQTIEQYSRDVSAFLMWTADPKLEARKQMGFRVLIYLFILAVILFLAKKKVWSRVKH